jgi:TPR repeat protein
MPTIYKALPYLERATAMGDSKAKIALARFLMKAGKPWTDTDRAFQLLKEASKTDPEAYSAMVDYFNRQLKQGTIKELTPVMLGWQARGGDQSAIEQLVSMNTARSNAVLGQLYAEGKGVKQDISAAYRYYVAAYEKGDKQAIYELLNLAQKDGATDEFHRWVNQLVLDNHNDARQ